MNTLGPHLLGRIHVPDDRDYKFADVIATYHAPDAAALDQPISSLVDKSWHYLCEVWQLLLEEKSGTKPTPAPVPPTPAPAPQPGGVVTWVDYAKLDQGHTGHCVGDGWSGWLASTPIPDAGIDQPFADRVYYDCKIVDGEPGQENGSTVRSGAKVMQSRGRLASYSFAASTAEVAVALKSGPVVFGTDWTNDMFTPSANGVVKPTGPVAGGHCYVCIGYDPAAAVFRFRNSWGAGWGDGGDFVIGEKDVAKLLKGFDSPGEACVALELSL